MVHPGVACYVWRSSFRSRLAMQAFSRLLSLLALTAAVSLAACKDESVPSTTPSSPDASAPAPAPTPVPPAAGDAPPADGAAPTDPAAGAAVTCTPDTRKGGMCTREYAPVCGTQADNTSKTFSNKCVACSDEKVVRYVAGPCPGDPAT
jgi:hypothetical protein